jgi:hypothetical protein
LLGALLEVAAASDKKEVERLCVGVRLLRLRSEALGQHVHLPLRPCDAGTSREIGAQGLSRERVAILRQEADRTAGTDRATVWGVEAGEQPQQGRLARTVRADEADPCVRRHDEIDVCEDDLCTMTLRNAGCDDYFNGNDLRMSAGSACALTQSGVVAYCAE